MADQLWKYQVHIPLNTTNRGNIKQRPMADINSEGIPICPAQGPRPHQVRCPKKGESSPVIRAGHRFHLPEMGGWSNTHPKDNLELYPKTPPNSPTFKA